VAENESGAEKKHAPSERRWNDAAEKGQLPKSRDVGSVVVLTAAAATLVFGSGFVAEPIGRFAVQMFALDGPQELTIGVVQQLGATAMWTAALALAAPLGAILVAGTLAGAAQTGLSMAPKALEPDWSRVNPLTGFQNHYMSATPVVELIKGVFKLVLLAIVTWYAIRGPVRDLPTLAGVAPYALPAELAEMAWREVTYALPLMVTLAAIDYGYAAYKQTEQLKMTDQEQREEHKEQDGDPHFKAHRRARARQIATRNAIVAVRSADVVITNPTHYAVAIRYERGKDAAPVVVAKGADNMAVLMRAEALRNDIPRVEDRPLARALYARTKEGQAIPEDLYVAVAKVLAWVWRRRAGRAT